MKNQSKEKRIRNLTQFYYSRPDVQKVLFEFSKNREVVPRYFEDFGKRPDSFQYIGDVFELVKKGATSFHCSQELWKDPLEISTGMNEKQLNNLRTGWDFLIDIDSKYLDYSKILAELVIKTLRFYGVKNIGLKFSGSKGFHIIIPWKAFPEEINEAKVSEKFPEFPRILTLFLMEATKEELIQRISQLTRPSKYIKDFQAPKEVMPDMILVSPRHLFRAPYSLHEKTSLASVVIKPEQLKNFQPRDADPLKTKIRNFMPSSEQGEASEFLREALDWHKNKNPEQQSETKSGFSEFKPLNISDLSKAEELFPPSIKKILKGVKDGRKRALFILINFLRSIGFEKKELEEQIFAWNEKNEIPLLQGYIKSQLSWSHRNKIVPPPNYDKDYYKGIGIIPTDEELRTKNPVNYMARKVLRGKTQTKKITTKDNFKNKEGF